MLQSFHQFYLMRAVFQQESVELYRPKTNANTKTQKRKENALGQKSDFRPSNCLERLNFFE
jgi:hypothetical protein